MERGEYIIFNDEIVSSDDILDIADKIVDILKKEKITYAVAKTILKEAENQLENIIIT